MSNTDASRFAWETPACVGLALSDLLTLLYRPDTLANSLVADAHRDDGKRFVARADEKLTAFIELESGLRV